MMVDGLTADDLLARRHGVPLRLRGNLHAREAGAIAPRQLLVVIDVTSRRSVGALALQNPAVAPDMGADGLAAAGGNHLRGIRGRPRRLRGNDSSGSGGKKSKRQMAHERTG